MDPQIQELVKTDERKFKISTTVEQEYDVDFVQAEIRGFQDAIEQYKKQLASQVSAVENTIKNYESMIEQRQTMLKNAEEKGVNIVEIIPEPAIEWEDVPAE